MISCTFYNDITVVHTYYSPGVFYRLCITVAPMKIYNIPLVDFKIADAF